MRSSDGGFTLFEVLGAVAILAILYTTLSTAAIRGLRSEGESRLMLEASLLADWELSEFELKLETGEAPEIGITENDEEDGFTVTWEVLPLQTPIFAIALEKGTDASNPVGQIAPLPPAQTGAAGDIAVPFLRVDLEVSWFEAGNERSVRRTIFAVDEDAAAKLAADSALNDSNAEGQRR
jgi:prepilin-type N-terminal cleavage/methylation domain-containing protein